jgi:uncharacterized protein
VKGLGKYSIPFKGLRDGQHSFRFDIDRTFFDAFDSSEIHAGSLIAEISLNKEPQLLEMDFFIHGTVEVSCDRCLDIFELPVQYKGRLFFKFGIESLELTDEIIILATGQTEINIAQYLYEFIHLSLPYTKVHPDINGKSGCDPEMIKKLDSLTVKESGKKEHDSRWDKLKEISN